MINELDAHIAIARRNASAERAFDATASSDENPWRGASDGLAALEAERAAENSRSKGEALVKALAAKSTLDDEIQSLTSEAQRLKDELDEINTNATIVRYDGAFRIAASLGIGEGFRGWQRWFESGRGHAHKTLYEAGPLDAWPETIRFGDGDRKIVLRRWDVRRSIAGVAISLEAATHRRNALVAAHPEIQTIA